MYKDAKCCIRTENGTTDLFAITTGVRQGCVLSPFLFIIVIDYMMRQAMDTAEPGISWGQTRRLADLDFADDITLIGRTAENLQHLISRLEQTARKVGLFINIQKTKIMSIVDKNETVISINQKQIQEIHNFDYRQHTQQ